MDVESIGLDECAVRVQKSRAAIMGRLGVLGSSCLSRASFGSGRQLSLDLEVRPGLRDFAESQTHG